MPEMIYRPYTKSLRVGAIANRHTMPVDEYLAPTVTVHGQKAYLLAWDMTHLWIKKHRKTKMIFYFTGMTEFTIGVLDALDTSSHPHLLMRYNRAELRYEPLLRKSFPIVKAIHQLAHIMRYLSEGVPLQLRIDGQNTPEVYAETADPDERDYPHQWLTSNAVEWIKEELRGRK